MLGFNKLVASGRMADIYEYEQGRLLKLNHSGYPAILAEMEAGITRAAWQAGLPVPEVFDCLEVDGRYGIVFERVHGQTLMNVLETHPLRFAAIARQLAQLHANMNACQAGSQLPSQKAGIENGIMAATGITEEERNSVLKILESLPEGSALCHGDFHPGNILCSESGAVIIDWLTGNRGDPLADVCRTLLIIESVVLPPETPPLMKLVLTVFRRQFTRVYLGWYLKLRPAKLQHIHRWRLPLITQRLREVEGYPSEKELLLKMMRSRLAKHS